MKTRVKILPVGQEVDGRIYTEEALREVVRYNKKVMVYVGGGLGGTQEVRNTIGVVCAWFFIDNALHADIDFWKPVPEGQSLTFRGMCLQRLGKVISARPEFLHYRREK